MVLVQSQGRTSSGPTVGRLRLGVYQHLSLDAVENAYQEAVQDIGL
jgi:hypothetical protein